MDVTLEDYSKGRHDLRFRREMTFEQREEACEALEYRSAVSEAVADVAGDVIPMVGNFTGFVTGGVAAISHLTKGGLDVGAIALKCDDLPFDEIKEIMDQKFSEIDRKLDENATAMKKLTEMVSKTLAEVEKIRADMDKGFKKVVEELQNLTIKDSITQIYNVIEFFNSESKRIRVLPKLEYVAKLEESDGFLDDLRRTRTPQKETLHTAMFNIFQNNAADPKSADDTKAFQALYALFYAAQSYVAIFAFLMESHSYLAEYSYQTGNYRVFNAQVNKIKTIYEEFKFSLVGKNYGFLIKVKTIMEAIKNKEFIRDVKNDLYKEICDREKSLDKFITQIKETGLPVIKDAPPQAIIQFKKPVYQTPLGSWKEGVRVRYAVQLEDNGIFSKLSPWSDRLSITNKACPSVKVPVDSEGRNRLVFRKINNDIPQLVGILVSPDTEFRDINRDLYNAAGAVDMESGTENVNELIKIGADVNAVFELGRSAMHRAAATGNKDVMNILLQNRFRDINLKDKKGYTPLHIAAESGTVEFIPEIIRKGADPDPTTNEKLYTPLHLASKNGFITAVKELVARSQMIEAKDKDGFMPLHYAVSGGYELIDTFFKYNQGPIINVNAGSETGLTPLHLAAIKGILPAIDALKQSNNLDPNVGDGNGMTPLHFAAMLGHVDVIQELLKMDITNINAAAEHNKWTPVHYAIYFKRLDAVKELVKYEKIDINLKALGGNTPLHLAALTEQFHFVIEVLIHGAKMEETNDDGYTALHMAAMLEEPIIAGILTQNGANVNAKSKNNETPLDIAIEKDRPKLVDYFNELSKTRRDVNFGIPHSRKSKLIDSLKFDIGYKKKPHYLNGVHQDIPLHPLKSIENTNSFKRSDIASFQNIDPIGTLLMLDLIIRKITKENYDLFSRGSPSNYEANARALDITGKFENILNSLSNSTSAEQIDLSEVYTKVRKALVSGRESKIANILCSYAENIPSMDSKYFDKLKTVYHKNSKPTNFNSESEAVVEIHNLLENACGGQNV